MTTSSVPSVGMLLACLCGLVAFVIVIVGLVRSLDSRGNRPVRRSEAGRRRRRGGRATVSELLAGLGLVAWVSLGPVALVLWLRAADKAATPDGQPSAVAHFVMWGLPPLYLTVLVTLFRVLVGTKARPKAVADLKP